MKAEMGERKGHWAAGIENDEDGGYEEFSAQECELCRSHLAGSRHGVTLLIEGDAPAPPKTITRRVVWEVDVEYPADTTDRQIAEAVAAEYFQERIANGEQDTACVFTVVRPGEHPGMIGIPTEVDLSK